MPLLVVLGRGRGTERRLGGHQRGASCRGESVGHLQRPDPRLPSLSDLVDDPEGERLGRVDLPPAVRQPRQRAPPDQGGRGQDAAS